MLGNVRTQRESTQLDSPLKRLRASFRTPCRRAACRQAGSRERGACRASKGQATVELGRSGLKVSRIGLGTLQWGDPGQGYRKTFSDEDIDAVFQTALSGGINFFDSAEVYGYQGIKDGTSSEHILGRLVERAKAGDRPVVVGSKFFTIPWTNLLVGGGWRLGRQSIADALSASLQRTGGAIDLYQVHFPFPTFPQQVLADALTDALEDGRVKAVGVCNYGLQELTELEGLLRKRGIPLASNQVKFSLLERKPLESGLLTACKDLGISLVAHSPLSQGLLTDKYVSEGGGAKAEKLRPLLKLMQFIGTVSGGRSVSEVALNYLVAHGAIPIPGAKRLQQVEDHVNALNWDLEENEVEMLNEKVASLNA